ncbi:MAG TPA: hypothetical protein PKE69_23510 [Pyrinomonadaceae bacterium]|mgnify:CR=1 FL=1|nr:hypothetical protein [Pyrinomonadaceae bacterium]
MIISVSLLEWSDAFLYESRGYTFIAVSVGFLLISLTAFKPKRAVNILSCPRLFGSDEFTTDFISGIGQFVGIYTAMLICPIHRLQLLLAIALSFAFTIISYYCVEKPFLKLKDKFSQNHKLAHN